MPKYKIKEGFEHVVISQEGVRRLDASTVESDNELNSAILTEIKDETTPVQSQSESVSAPAAPAVAPATPPVNPPAAPVAPAQNQTQVEGAK